LHVHGLVLEMMGVGPTQSSLAMQFVGHGFVFLSSGRRSQVLLGSIILSLEDRRQDQMATLLS
jgi:hypothetical protein